jgi:phosphonate transport system substrate-binding protein
MLKAASFLALLLLTGLPAAAETLVFAPLPMETPYTVAAQWKPLLDYLEEQLGTSLQIDYSGNNDEVVEKFTAGHLDLAYLGPLPYVKLRKSFPAAEPVVVFREKDGASTYTCALIAAADSRLDLKSLKQKRIALTQPLSTCGYFSVQGLLQQQGRSLEENRYRYLGPHDAVALAVVRGAFDAGGVKTAIARKYAHLGLTVIAESPAMPGLALIANRNRLSAQRIEQIRQLLLHAPVAVRQQWGDNIRHGVAPAADADYDGIRRLPMLATFPEQGNY